MHEALVLRFVLAVSTSDAFGPSAGLDLGAPIPHAAARRAPRHSRVRRATLAPAGARSARHSSMPSPGRGGRLAQQDAPRLQATRPALAEHHASQPPEPLVVASMGCGRNPVGHAPPAAPPPNGSAQQVDALQRGVAVARPSKSQGAGGGAPKVPRPHRGLCGTSSTSGTTMCVCDLFNMLSRLRVAKQFGVVSNDVF